MVIPYPIYNSRNFDGPLDKAEQNKQPTIYNSRNFNGPLDFKRKHSR